MPTKHLSTRAAICGRGGGCHGGHSAVEQSSYIDREEMESEYDGKKYYPKYSEDLVHCEVMLPPNAPREFSDPAVLWNNVEMTEKGDNAQLARTFRVELPNEWSYELAREVMRDYIQREFVDEGMCVQFAIHDSENKNTGQHNLHCHMMMTLRSLDEEGEWMKKQRKEYLKDENGERIPLIDKDTGKQKVDGHNRKQWKCKTVSTNDWSSREKVKLWRTDFANTINAVNARIGKTENFWEHRSFKEQGLDIEPQIHLGEKANALERAGIPSIRGNINREIIDRNRRIEEAKAACEAAKKALEAIVAVPAYIVAKIVNEIIEMIRKVAERNKDKLKLPKFGTKYFAKMSDRSIFQDIEKMEEFVNKLGLNTFEEMHSFMKEQEIKYKELSARRIELYKRQQYLEDLLERYGRYEPFIKYNKELWTLRGREQNKYRAKHVRELASFDVYRSSLKEAIKEENKNITPLKWRMELDSISRDFYQVTKQYSDTMVKLATMEVLEHNRKELSRIMENESRHVVSREHNKIPGR